MSVRHAVLGLLAGKPSHGYELRAAFEAVVGKENWDVKPAQIYTTLVRMEKLGLVAEQSVEQAGGPEKRIYAITPAGHAALRAWFGANIEPEHQRDEFYIKLMLGLATGAADPVRLIHAQRGYLYRQLHELTEQRARIDPSAELAKVLLLEKAAMHLEADLRWLDLTEGRLDEIRQQPLPEPDVKPRGRPRKRLPQTDNALPSPRR